MSLHHDMGPINRPNDIGEPKSVSLLEVCNPREIKRQDLFKNQSSHIDNCLNMRRISLKVVI